MISLLAPPHLSPEQYLTQEETALTKSEYHNGTLIPRIGGSINHNRITAVLNGSCGVPPEGAHHTKGFSHRDPYN
ncbi:PDDEXK family nuclease [Prochlorothrix hollandica]|uniref:Uncharacterized protein n=1 Tax=Prochlorothrix hollandica PCC 9006 = CALU 1027 TaxID=317619 RepID=A0A0M2PXD8_PROHO|nr:hypothetical protein [Prochlorothrix hollandica]KKI99051.1 hypothetical protein PROH_14725 [Prochlorothrix hollandica PCC 9006 = CALU 1027]